VSVEQLSQILVPPVKRSLSDEVVERLRRAILSGQLSPDDPLRESVLAESMGVSRGPIREALSRLQREGLVIDRSNGRSFVARLSRQDLDEVYSLRRAIERFAVERVCGTASEADLAEMQALVDEMAAHIQQGVTEQKAAELDLRFHDVLYRASRHQRLLNVWTTLRPQIHVFLLSRNVASPDFRDSAVQGHQRILDAIRDGDQNRAQALIEEHLDYAYARVIGSYTDSSDSEC
jgi:DNA-binding GntR family transcriptional regulator